MPIAHDQRDALCRQQLGQNRANAGPLLRPVTRFATRHPCHCDACRAFVEVIVPDAQAPARRCRGRRHRTRTGRFARLAAGRAAIASRWCCRAAARSAPIRRASIRRCTRPASSPIGCRAFRSAPSTPRSSPAIRRDRRLRQLRDVLGADHRPQDLAVHAGRRRLPQGAQCHELADDHDAWASPASSSRASPTRG